MSTAKQAALETIAQLPDDTDLDEIMYRLYVLDKIRKGDESAARGETTTTSQLKQEIESW